MLCVCSFIWIICHCQHFSSWVPALIQPRGALVFTTFYCDRFIYANLTNFLVTSFILSTHHSSDYRWISAIFTFSLEPVRFFFLVSRSGLRASWSDQGQTSTQACWFSAAFLFYSFSPLLDCIWKSVLSSACHCVSSHCWWLAKQEGNCRRLYLIMRWLHTVGEFM